MSDGFLQDLSRPRPDPGGGAAAAFGARVGLALLLKVVRLEEQRPSGRNPGPDFWPTQYQEVLELEARCDRLQEEDVQAYALLAESFRRGGKEREAAAFRATAIPHEIAVAAVQGLSLAAAVGSRCARHLLPDIQVAVELLAGAGRGAAAIARANLPWLATAGVRQEWQGKLQAVLGELEDVAAHTRSLLLARLREGAR